MSARDTLSKVQDEDRRGGPRTTHPSSGSASGLTVFLRSRRLGRWLRRAGLEIVPVKQYLAVAGGVDDAIHTFMNWDARPLFEVDLHMMRNQFGFGYGESGWHYFTDALSEYEERGRSLSYRGSRLAAFYTRFQPTTVGGLLGLDNRPSPYLGWSISNGLQLPWFAQPSCRRHQGMWQYSGPVSAQFGEAQLAKLIGLLESIRQVGYAPESEARRSADAHIQGYLLRDGPDYRFVVTNGTHRAAALAILGQQRMPVTFRDHNRRVIDIRDAADWPAVRSGELTRELAEQVFIRFFHENGRRVAVEHGLVGRP